MPAARLLDLTRSLRRAGRIETGIDRVEHAYLEHFLADEVPVFGLVRTPLGYILLDQNGMRAVLDRIDGVMPWGDVDLISRLPRSRSAEQARAESDIRRLATARVLPSRLTKMLAEFLPDGYVYYNVGHSNLTDRVLGAIHASGGRIAAMVHDVIPLEHPEFQRDGSVEPFRDKMRRLSASADWVIYNSNDTRERAEKFMQDWGRLPRPIVAHLGMKVPRADASQLPENFALDRPYFVTVGTIEPRKNHAFLLDIWEELGREAPPLFICGTRGWKNEDVFSRLDLPVVENNIHELSGLSDSGLAALVQGAAGSLFPSLAEGYGYPPSEALALGSRVLCNYLNVFGEILGDKPVYAPVSDRYLWINTIKSWEKHPSHARSFDPFVGPSWSDHFKAVLRLR